MLSSSCFICNQTIDCPGHLVKYGQEVKDLLVGNDYKSNVIKWAHELSADDFETILDVVKTPSSTPRGTEDKQYHHTLARKMEQVVTQQPEKCVTEMDESLKRVFENKCPTSYCCQATNHNYPQLQNKKLKFYEKPANSLACYCCGNWTNNLITNLNYFSKNRLFCKPYCHKCFTPFKEILKVGTNENQDAFICEKYQH